MGLERGKLEAKREAAQSDLYGRSKVNGIAEDRVVHRAKGREGRRAR